MGTCKYVNSIKVSYGLPYRSTVVLEEKKSTMESKEDNVEYTLDLAKTLYQYSVDKQFTDFKIRAGNKTFYCHKAVLCAKSKYFESICQSGMSEAALDNTIITDEDAELLGLVIKFMYLGQTDVTPQNVESLLRAAEFLKHTELKHVCEKFMIQHVSVKNLPSYKELAESTSLETLRDECVRFAQKRASDVTNRLVNIIFVRFSFI